MIINGKYGRVRRKGTDMEDLRRDCFNRDGGRCTDCGVTVFDGLPDWHHRKAHMAHVVSRGRGGSDAIENVHTLCGACHLVEEHQGGKVVRRK